MAFPGCLFHQRGLNISREYDTPHPDTRRQPITRRKEDGMINNDEIAKLAREYAEGATKAVVSDPNLSDADIKGIKRDVAEYAEEVFSWLLRTHCIVSKEKVRSVYEGLADTMTYAEKNSELHLRVVAASKRILLESLFDAETFKDSEI